MRDEDLEIRLIIIYVSAQT